MIVPPKRLAAVAQVLAVIVGFSIATFAVAAFAFVNVFSFFSIYDDEGYLLVSLDQYRNGLPLYDAVYSQYGPAHFQLLHALMTIAGLPVTHDGGRFLTMALWTATSLLCGLAVFGLTRNVWLGCSVQVLLTTALLFTRNEPLHPGGVTALLLSCMIVTAVCMERRPGLAWTLLGAFGAAMALIKINVGGLALVAAGFTALCATASIARRRLVMMLAGAAVISIPVLLMGPKFQLPWVREYCLLVTAALLPLVLMIVRDRADLEDRHGLWWLSTGAAGATMLICSIALLQGTTPGALIQAVLIRALHHPDAFMLPLALPGISGALAVIASAIGTAAALARRRWERVSSAMPFFRIAVGLAFWITASGNSRSWRLGFLLAPLAWLAAMPPDDAGDSRALAFGRRFLPLLAVLQTMHAYPVAGSQFLWSSFLLVPAGAICIHDGARSLGRFLPQPRRLFANGLGFLLCLVVAAMLWRSAKVARWRYLGHEPLGLPGAEYVRLEPAEARALRRMTEETRARCRAFITVPGMASFHFWTGKEPLTAQNAGAWPYLFDVPTQQRILHKVERVPDLCVIWCQQTLETWSGGRPLPPSPLFDYVRANFVPVAAEGRYELLARR